MARMSAVAGAGEADTSGKLGMVLHMPDCISDLEDRSRLPWGYGQRG